MMDMAHRIRNLVILLALLLIGCVKIPDNVTPVDHFSLDRYLGKWYEIARLDHSFERGLSRVTADYSLREDGGVRVLNRGYSEKEQEWKEALLAYYCLMMSPKPVTHAALDASIDELLLRRFGFSADFEIGGALTRLKRLGLLCESGGTLSALPLPAAIERLETEWAQLLRA